MNIIAKKIAIDFTDDKITSCGGSVFLRQTAAKLGLPELLRSALGLKVRDRGACDSEMMLSLIYSLANGDGAISDVDRLGADEARRELLNLERVPDPRRLGEYLCRFDEAALDRFYQAARAAAAQVAPAVIEHELAEQGYLPVFMDGSGIEVSGDYSEGAGELYDGSVGYWLHGVFVGPLWTAQRLWPGGVDVARGWKGQFKETAELIGSRGPVWARLDNAYYRGSVVEYLDELNWDFSISVTNKNNKHPILEIVTAFWEEDWTPIRDDNTEHAAFVYYQPAEWEEEQVYVVVRSMYEGRQKLLYPRYTVILVSRDDMPLPEIVSRHRGKQGQENAFKGPLIDLDLHHPPCRRFTANRAFYTAGQIAQILLLSAQYLLLPQAARQHGLRTIIRDFIRAAAKLVKKSRQLILKFTKQLPARTIRWILHAADRIEALANAPP